jgi:lysophospholipase L1-like esterase
VIIFETKKVFKNLNINETKKKFIQKIVYLIIICGIIIVVVLGIHKESPAGNIRFVRVILILVIIAIGGKITKEISNTKTTNLTKNSTLFLFSGATFLAFVEILFMFVSVSQGGGEAYSGKIWMARYWNPINKFGFRDEFPKKSENNIFFVGDSFTAGWGIKHIEDRFGEIATKEINKSGKRINEINLGRYGADTKIEYYIFEKFIKKTGIKPNQIVLQFFINDMDNFIPKNKRCVSHHEHFPRWIKIMNEGSYLFNYIKSLYPTNIKHHESNKECDYIEQLKYIYHSDYFWKKEEKQLNKFQEFCVQNNIPLTIVFFPFMEDLKLAKKLNIENRISKYCNLNNIEFLNVTNLLRTLSQEKRQVSVTDSHASVDVNKLVGEKLATLIKI